MKRILVVDDEKNMCMVLKMLLENEGYSVITAFSGKEAMEHIYKNEIIDLIISDLKMPEIDGIKILNFLNNNNYQIPLIMITAYGSIENAVEAMKKGAIDFITKPFNKDFICLVVKKIFKLEDLKRENSILKFAIQEEGIVYKSKAMKEIMDTVKKIANVSSPVLILGESGTGKELIARAIYSYNCKNDEKGYVSKPFISINCPAVPESLLESELFGYKKGAFTGAAYDFSGKIRLAEDGILFLDEIADIPLNIQPKLLRFIEEKEIETLGAATKIKVNTRIICATNCELTQLVNDGLFRKDLYYRINTITLYIPPLRERKEDILPITNFFLKKYSKELNRDIKELAADAKDILENYLWPGNVRELRNIVERAVVLSDNKDIIKLSDLPSDIQKVKSTSQKNESKLDSIEKELILKALNKTNNISAAARDLGISRSTIRYRMQKYNIKFHE